MKVLIAVLVCGINAVYGDCPARMDLECQMYERGLENCNGVVRNTFIEYNGKKCDACRICVEESAAFGCPQIRCPYERLEETYPMDCGIFPHPMKMFIDGRICDACETFTKDCSDMSWVG